MLLEAHGAQAAVELAGREWAQKLRAAEDEEAARREARTAAHTKMLEAMDEQHKAEARALGFPVDGLDRDGVISLLDANLDAGKYQALDEILRQYEGLVWLADILAFNRGLRDGLLNAVGGEIMDLLELAKNLVCWMIREFTGLDWFAAEHSAIVEMFAALKAFVAALLDDPGNELAKLAKAILEEFEAARKLFEAGKYYESGKAFGKLLWDLVSMVKDLRGLVKSAAKLGGKLSPVALAAHMDDAAKGVKDAKGAGGKAARAADAGDGAAANAARAADKSKPDAGVKADLPKPRLGYTPDGRLKWGPSKGMDAQAALAYHWRKHKGDFPELDSALEYAEKAYDFVTNPPGNTDYFKRPNGQFVYYNTQSKIFAIREADGTPSTFYKSPEGRLYFEREKRRNKRRWR